MNDRFSDQLDDDDSDDESRTSVDLFQTPSVQLGLLILLVLLALFVLWVTWSLITSV